MVGVWEKRRSARRNDLTFFKNASLPYTHGVMHASKGGMMLAATTVSRPTTPSPAMFASAHNACSRVCSLGEDTSRTRLGTAPARITSCVSADVPLAILVTTQHASY